MITITEYQKQDIAVFGLGKAGEAAVAALSAGGAKLWVGDDNTANTAAVASRYKLPLSVSAAWPWNSIKALVLSPGVPLTHPRPHPIVELARQHHCPIIGDIELLQRACPEATYIAITGTNGKSTTTTLIGHILKTCGKQVEVGGNLGTPALSLAPLGRDGVYVLELSSYQLDLVRTTRFNAVVWLNISPDHIDRHGTLEGYIQAKEHIFERQQADDVAIIGVDDEWSESIVLGTRYSVLSKVVPISVCREMKKGVYVEAGILKDRFFTEYRVPSTEYDLHSIATLTGRHNWQNAACAYAAARSVGIAPEAIYQAMKTFPGLRHRLQLVATVNGIRFINDSKATNADATSNALAPYDTIYWILGGKPKEGGITSLSPYFSKIAHAFLIGEAAQAFAATLKGKVLFTQCGTLDVAVQKSAEMAFFEKKKEAVVLLSPACASFDQFKNFEERGDVFCKLVNSLPRRGRVGVGACSGGIQDNLEQECPPPGLPPAGGGV
jgi:UDP-N-acetylmuramoylalanine--D-glutamate ligase